MSAKKEQYQSVWITLSDGTKHGFLGKAAVKPGDTRTITNVAFTEPKDFPPGYTFAPIEEDAE